MDKMSKEIRERYCSHAIKKEEEDNPATGVKWTDWEILWTFMQEQVEMSRRLTRSSRSHTEVADVHRRYVANPATIRSQQAEFTPCSVCQEIHTFTHSSGEVRNSTRFADCG